MDKLTIKQKAERYDQALERAKKWRNAPNIDKMPTYGNRIIEEIFPELKESEDEKIRKELIKFVKVNIPNEERYIAWLEKMAKSPHFGEHKPAWSKEDKEMLREALVLIETVEDRNKVKDCFLGVKTWLKSLKDRVQSQPKQEENKGNLGGISSNWSEEDKRLFSEIILRCKKYGHQEQIDWLKSLKQRIGG